MRISDDSRRSDTLERTFLANVDVDEEEVEVVKEALVKIDEEEVEVVEEAPVMIDEEDDHLLSGVLVVRLSDVCNSGGRIGCVWDLESVELSTSETTVSDSVVAGEMLDRSTGGDWLSKALCILGEQVGQSH